MNGIVKRLLKDRGFGFIDTESGDLFFHASGMEGGYEAFDELNEGDEVSYELGQGRDGKSIAAGVVLVNAGAGMSENADEEADEEADDVEDED